MRTTASLNSDIISGVTAFLSTPLTLAMALRKEPRWSMAAAAITPREFETASRPLILPALIFMGEPPKIILSHANGLDGRKRRGLYHGLEAPVDAGGRGDCRA